MKATYYIIGALFAGLIVIVIGLSVIAGYLGQYQGVQTIVYPDQYYEALRRSCRSDQCCLTSVEVMFQKGYRLAKDNQCPKSMVKNLLRCYRSYVWCEPRK